MKFLLFPIIPHGQKSLPAWGVWIEIATLNASLNLFLVTPRMGSVD